MTLHTEVPPEGSITIPIDTDRRLLVEQWENGHGLRFVTVAPQFRDRSHLWRLSHSGLILAPEVARELAPALLLVADAIDAGPRP